MAVQITTVISLDEVTSGTSMKKIGKISCDILRPKSKATKTVNLIVATYLKKVGRSQQKAEKKDNTMTFFP